MEKSTITQPERRVIHQTNNFLTLCLAHGELALDSEDDGERAEALATILEGAREMADWLAAHRRTLEALRRDRDRPLPPLDASA
ncbi:MAG: hypothetical protein QF599_03970 [Planctomycetota bacterium]|jgi:hypothetical protein|nr:hypothetical protein [Planctomycetota bacterium]MDP6520719.1 hypothetical protein [Planctomycetota bacterium]MDP6955110.1 hypothetical protein [Planctomycetota bacterium]